MSTVTFGKHRGNPLEELAQDLSYLSWLEQQEWWPEKWEYKALIALQNGEAVPDAPKKRPILEEEIDWATERPAKTRKLTHRDFSDKARTVKYECPNCACHSNIAQIGGDNNTTLALMCRACGQHGDASLKCSGGTAAIVFSARDCPAWSGATPEDYKAACQNCPDKKGIYKDHTRCGCWKQYECTCSVVET